MKIACLIILLLCCTAFVQAQYLSLPELLNLTSTSSDRFVQFIGRKGYRPVAADRTMVKAFHPKDTVTERFLVKHLYNQYASLRLEKMTPEEYDALKRTALDQGFQQGRTSDKVLTELFEKGAVTIMAAPEINLDEEKRWYNITIERRNLPRLKELVYAEDLLAFNSHRQLVEVFGKNNVHRDEYHQPNGRMLTCSVVYPNTSREAIFLWKDADNLRQLASVRVGGNRHTSGALQAGSQIAQNEWFSRQGVYATMTLNQLQAINAAPLNFFGWGGGAQGTLCPGNKGRLDFAFIDLEFSCLNCNDDAYRGKQQHSSESAIADSRRIYVTTMVFFPPPIAEER